MAVDYATLVNTKDTDGAIRNWVNRADIPVTNILIEAQAYIYENLRVREMMIDAAFTFASGDDSTALPSGFLDPIQFVPYEYGEPLPYYHEQKLPAVRDSAGALQSGTPSCWTIIGEVAYVDCLPTADFGGRLMYYKQPDDLSVSNTTNFITRRFPSLLRYACQMKAYEHMKDTSRTQAYLALTMGAIASAAKTSDLSRRGQLVPF